MILKAKIFKSIGFKIIAFYTIMSLINLSFIISIIFENQVDTIGENTMLESEKQISELIGAMKKFTVEMKKGSMFKSVSENDSLQQLIRIVDLHFSDFMIISDKENVLYKSGEKSELPESYRDDSLRAMTSSALSGKDYYLRIDEGKRILNFYIPLNDFYQDNSILLVKKDISAMSRSLADLYKQVSYVIIVVVFFHLIFAGILYWSMILPLKAIADAARNFTSGDMNARVEMSGRHSEFDFIASAFNDMIESSRNSITALSAEMESAKSLNRKKDLVSTRDELTGLLNINYFNERLDEEILLAKGSLHSFSLMLIDIDDFSRTNALYGSQTGDIMLHQTAKKIAATCGCGDIPARIGGEEFAVISKAGDQNSISELAEKIRRSVAENGVITPDGELSVTVSIGIATVDKGAVSIEQGREGVLSSALSALAKAKKEGKNRVGLSD